MIGGRQLFAEHGSRVFDDTFRVAFGGDLKRANVIVEERERRPLPFRFVWKNQERHFRIAHGVAVLLTVVGHADFVIEASPLGAERRAGDWQTEARDDFAAS